MLDDGLREEDVEEWVPAASLMHSNGDAMDIAVRQGRICGVRGRAVDRVNRGRLCPKDLYGWRAGLSPDRLTTPLLAREGVQEPVGWDAAMDAIVARTRELLAEHGPESIAFYTSGQLYLEEYYTLAVLARAGIGTNHLDGNTRLCTATAAEALKESFGSDGQPASYADVDQADVIALYGHNVAETQPVLWMRILDRLAGPHPPELVCVDPRHTAVAERASVHLAPRPGTNLALLNALVHQLIADDRIDHAFLASHTVGFADLRAAVAPCSPAWAADLCDVPAGDIRRAAQLIGAADRLLSTVLQGVYQSHQATATAVQVNNIHLLRAMIGRPGAGVLQMNGQPTAQNTRECGADGELPGFRNWQNPAHLDELADLWRVDRARLDHGAPSTHAMEIFRLAESGDVRMLWVSATNPAVSLPELSRIREILGRPDLFLVVQDIFPTETTRFADVVLPAATWGEKTGTFTNADRTVHFAGKAMDPPGESRADLDVFLDYARRMDFRNRDGDPLIAWDGPEAAFDAWKRCSAGRPCDYTGLTYGRLREGGVPWPDGAERLYADGVFPTAFATCETYGKNLETGDPVTPDEYRDLAPDGRAIIKAAAYTAPEEPVSSDYPFTLVTGRTIHHFHTRTKTARVPELQEAAPDVWVEIAPADADRLGLTDGDRVAVCSPRGSVRAWLRVRDIREGTLFLPFHYGYWDTPDGRGPGPCGGSAANELTPTAWDPVSQQPCFKYGTARIRFLGRISECSV
ncbi:nitrate reductase [Actinocorallia aurea]